MKNFLPDAALVRARNNEIWSSDIQLFFGANLPDGSFLYVSKVELKKVAPDVGIPREETGYVEISKNSAQVLMDDLWNCGIRPTEGSGSAGSFAARGEHLDDMRSLVAHMSGAKMKGCDNAPAS